MINGRLGLLLVFGFVFWMSTDKLTVMTLGPADVFMVLLMLATFPVLWRYRMRLASPLALGMWLIFIGSLIATLSNIDITASLFALLQEAYLYLAFVTVVNVVANKETLLTIRKAWVIAAGIVGLLLVMDRLGIHIPYIMSRSGKYAFLASGETDPQAFIEQAGRAAGPFNNYNAAAGYMLIGFFIILATPYPRNRLLRAVLLGVSGLGILATGSNGALMGWTIGLLVAATYWLYHRGRALLFSVGLASLLAVLVIMSLPWLASAYSTADQNSALRAFSRPDEKLFKRLNLWSMGTTLFEEYPLGTGPSTSVTAVGGGLHNDFVAYLTERGPLGFIGLIVLIGEMLFWLGMAARDGTSWQHHQVTAGLLGGLVGIWAMATVHEVTHGRPLWLLFAVIYLHYKFLKLEREPAVPTVAIQAQPGSVVP